MKCLLHRLVKLSELKEEIEKKKAVIRMLPANRRNDKLEYELLQLKYKFNEAKPWFVRKIKY